MFKTGCVPPNKGVLTTTKPMTEETISKIKDYLSDDLKWLSLFTVAVNSAFRASDLLKLHINEIEDDGRRITIFKREKKTKKNRKVMLNADASDILRKWLEQSQADGYVWQGPRKIPHTHGYYGIKLREWCDAVGADNSRVASHSCRKSWARINYERGARIATLMVALNHSSERQTLTYINVFSEEIEQLYSAGI